MRIPGRHRSETTLSAYGVNVRLSVPDLEMLELVVRDLPRSWATTTEVPSTDRTASNFTVLLESGRYVIHAGDRLQTQYADRRVATWMLRRMLRRALTHGVQDRTCINASVVSYKGRLIMLPARAFAGTTTLVTALVEAGAELYSDELTLVAADGRLVSDLELRSGAPSRAAPLDLVALTVYRPGTAWAPKAMSQAEGVVALMAYAANRERPAETLAALKLALHQASILEGDRGEAVGTAAALLKAVETEA